jgi:SOS response regulatory protein OraA/RecX
LLSKGLSEEKANEAISEMGSHGVIDDKRFVQNSIFSLVQDFRGKQFISKKFQELEIPKEFYEIYLEEISEETYQKKCAEYIEKKWGTNLQKLNPAKIFSCIKTLFSRGYEIETIRICLKQKGVDPEILEYLESL